MTFHCGEKKKEKKSVFLYFSPVISLILALLAYLIHELCQWHLRNLQRHLQREEKQLFPLREELRCCLTERHSRPLAGMTHSDHTQQPNNKQPICSKSDFKHLRSRYLQDGSWSPLSLSRAPTCALGVFPCILQAANSRDMCSADGLLASAAFDAHKIRAPLGTPGILRAYVPKPFSTLVSQNQGKGTQILWPDCSTFPLKGVCKAVAACQR